MLVGLVKAQSFERLILFLQVLQKLALTHQFEILAGPSFSNSLSFKESERINSVYNYLKGHHLGQITLDDISGVMHMSNDTFSRFFKKTFGTSFFSFLNEYKISMACKMLINKEFSISEIGYKVGYNNLTFFHRQFQNKWACRLQNTERPINAYQYLKICYNSVAIITHNVSDKVKV